MLDLLRAEETVTVTRCALVLGESTASCSYHLGILAKYGYIVAAPAEGREKPWRLADQDSPVSLAPRGPGADQALASREAFRSWIDYETAQLKDYYLRRREIEPDEWQQALRIAGQGSWLTPAQATEVGQRLIQLLSEISEREDQADRPDGARLVRMFVAMALTPDSEPPRHDS